MGSPASFPSSAPPEFLHTALLYQATNTRNINVLAVLKQYLVFVKKEQWGDFSVQLDFVSA